MNESTQGYPLGQTAWYHQSSTLSNQHFQLKSRQFQSYLTGYDGPSAEGLEWGEGALVS